MFARLRNRWLSRNQWTGQHIRHCVKLAFDHAYYVTNVDKEHKTVTVRNPWGWDAGETTLTWDEFSSSFVEVEAAKPNDRD